MPRRAIVASAAAALAVAAAVVLGGATAASAHAELTSTVPASGAHLDAAPTEVTLQFSERVSAPEGAVRVLDTSGDRVDTGDVDVDGSTMTAGLEAGLPDGTYVVSWHAISADSHPVRGAFTFSVGDGPAVDDATIAGLLDGGGSDRPWQIAAAVLRGIAYLGALVAAGAAVYLALVEDRPDRRTWRLVFAAGAAAAVALLAGLPVQAALATGLGIGSFFRSGVAGDVLGNGVAVSIVVTLAGLAAIVAALALRGAARRPLFVAGAVAAIGGFAAAGHTTQTDPTWLATTSDVVHAGAGAAWFGGLVLLALSLRRRTGDEPGPGADAVRRFSRLATVAVLAIGGAGVALAWGEVRYRDALTSTTYGKLLLAKVAVVGAVMLVGFYNRNRLVPAIAGGDQPDHARRALGRTVAVEAGALVVAVGLTAVLVNVTPARAAVVEPQSATAELGDGTVNLVVDPARVGPLSIHLYVLDEVGRPVDLPDGSEVTVGLGLPSADIGPIEADAFAAGPGHYQVDTSDVTLPGTWQIDVHARVSRFESQSATVEIPIRP